MKNSGTLITIIILLYSCSSTRKNIENDLEKMNMKGNVKSIEEFDQNSDENNKYYYYFNEMGYLISRTKLSYFYNLKTKFKSLYKYDSANKNIEILEYRFDSSFDKMPPATNDSSLSRKIIITYSNGLLKTKNLFDCGSFGQRFHNRITYYYDENNNVIQENDSSSGGSTAPKALYKYNNQNRKIEKTIYLRGIESKSEFEYDDNGNVIKQTFYDSTGKIKRTNLYTYELDEKGNWTKQTTYDPHAAVPQQIILRKIQYY